MHASCSQLYIPLWTTTRPKKHPSISKPYTTKFSIKPFHSLHCQLHNQQQWESQVQIVRYDAQRLVLQAKRHEKTHKPKPLKIVLRPSNEIIHKTHKKKDHHIRAISKKKHKLYLTMLADDDVRPQFDDIIINIDDISLHLPPILTKPAANKSPIPKSLHSVEIPTENGAVRSRKTNWKSRVKIRVSGRKLAGKMPESGGRKSVKDGTRYLFYPESFALVKSSFDPERDFKDSMMEMIVENRIRELKDLEDLLACYLSLNSNQYHDVIISAFEQIWFDMKE